MAAKFIIYIGTKTYSSWSLRGWLATKATLGNNFEEVKCLLAGDGAPTEKIHAVKSELLRHSPTGKLPALVDKEMGDIVVYDSLAIVLYLAERFPASNLLPQDIAARGLCFSACAEMHSGFFGLRSNWPHHCLSVARVHGASALATKPEVQADVARIGELWTSLRSRYQTLGPFLFGHFSAADCMYAPVAIRFNTYDPDLVSLAGHPLAQEYVRAILANEWVQEWVAGARLEGPEWRIPQYEMFSDK